jgi:hypothetical protein
MNIRKKSREKQFGSMSDKIFMISSEKKRHDRMISISPDTIWLFFLLHCRPQRFIDSGVSINHKSRFDPAPTLTKRGKPDKC